MPSLRRILASAAVVLACFSLTPHASADRRGKAKDKPASQADLDRLEKKVEAQQRTIDQMIALQRQYLQALAALAGGSAAPAPVAVDEPRAAPPTEEPEDGPAAAPARPAAAPARRPAAAAQPKASPKPRAEEGATGIVVGKVTGAGDAVVYIEDIVAPSNGTAVMKQEGKQFLPRVLVVQKGTKVSFPNLDAIFHNVFSVSPDHSFDLGSYPQGQSKTVKMWKPGVVTVYCNMHPQMVGHILVVPNGNYVRAGKDGFFRITNVPPGPHRVVAWAPNAQPTKVQATVTEGEVVTVELALTKRASSMHTKKDGLPYGSYEQ